MESARGLGLIHPQGGLLPSEGPAAGGASPEAARRFAQQQEELVRAREEVQALRCAGQEAEEQSERAAGGIGKLCVGRGSGLGGMWGEGTPLCIPCWHWLVRMVVAGQPLRSTPSSAHSAQRTAHSAQRTAHSAQRPQPAPNSMFAG